MVHGLSIVPVRDYLPDSAVFDGGLARMEVADDTPDGELPFTTVIQEATVMGRPVKPDFMPTRIEWRDPQPIPDFEATRVVNVSERAKALIEGAA